jgi:hypothetical protein
VPALAHRGDDGGAVPAQDLEDAVRHEVDGVGGVPAREHPCPGASVIAVMARATSRTAVTGRSAKAGMRNARAAASEETLPQYGCSCQSVGSGND